MQALRLFTVLTIVCVLRADPLPLRAAENVDLKVTRVALFSSGVGFFHREASVTDSATTQLQFRTAQINDILKSLVVQDLDGGTIGAVSYASQDPIEKTLASFGVNLTGNPSIAKILGQLRGEAVEIAGPRQLKGTIIGVETHEIVANQQKMQVEFLNVLTETGLQQLKLGELTGIKLVNEKVSAELNKALAALAGGHDADRKSVVLHFEGTGKRRVSASFLLETPIWKTSYRLVLSPDKKPFLQGWAIVENATQEDWKDVRLSLISGRPISFVMDLYTPLYLARPLEEMELYASLRPPTYAGGEMMGGGMMGGGGGMEKNLGQVEAEGKDLKLQVGVPARPRAVTASGRKAGRMVTEHFYADKAVDGPVDLVFGEGAGVRSVASAQQAGELFEYAIQAPVTLARQNSAMLPVLNEDIGGEKMSIYNPNTHPKHPLNGLMLENTSGLHLMQGPITVFDGNVYAGDAKLPDLRPGEKRLLAYALDLGMEVRVDGQKDPNELVSLRITKGTLWHRHRYLNERTYHAKNKDAKDRTLLIEQEYSADWKLLEPQKPFDLTESQIRFKLTVPAGKTVDQIVKLQRDGDESVVVSSLNDEQVLFYFQAKVISPAMRGALEKVMSFRADLNQASRARAAREVQVKESTDEQTRIRENLKTLDRSSDAYARQLKKFDALETAIESARDQLASARKDEESKKAALENYLGGLTVE